MIISYDDLWHRLVDHGLGRDVVRPSDGKRIRYAVGISVGVNDADPNVSQYSLYPRHEKKTIRKQLEATLKEMFTDCENVTVQKATKPIVAGPAR